jgi:hypothetical protein
MTEYQAMSIGGRFDYRNADQVIRGRDIMLLDWDPSGFILIIAMGKGVDSSRKAGV